MARPIVMSLLRHCRNHATARDETTTLAADRPWLDLAMTGGSDRFIDLFVRSAPWRRAQ